MNTVPDFLFQAYFSEQRISFCVFNSLKGFTIFLKFINIYEYRTMEFTISELDQKVWIANAIAVMYSKIKNIQNFKLFWITSLLLSVLNKNYFFGKYSLKTFFLAKNFYSVLGFEPSTPRPGLNLIKASLTLL